MDSIGFGLGYDSFNFQFVEKLGVAKGVNWICVWNAMLMKTE